VQSLEAHDGKQLSTVGRRAACEDERLEQPDKEERVDERQQADDDDDDRNDSDFSGRVRRSRDRVLRSTDIVLRRPTPITSCVVTLSRIATCVYR